jgi:hypothetical protein
MQHHHRRLGGDRRAPAFRSIPYLDPIGLHAAFDPPRSPYAAIEAKTLVLHCSKSDKTAPAKGAMAFAAASLYWCRKQGWGCVEA